MPGEPGSIGFDMFCKTAFRIFSVFVYLSDLSDLCDDVEKIHSPDRMGKSSQCTTAPAQLHVIQQEVCGLMMARWR